MRIYAESKAMERREWKNPNREIERGKKGMGGKDF